jgi:CRISPR-associated endonuclease/helicase Cas3
MLLSHVNPDVPLKDHLCAVAERAQNTVESKTLNLSLVTKTELATVAYISGVIHDFGKATTFFQQILTGKINSHRCQPHAMISSLLNYHALKLHFRDHPFIPLWGYLTVRSHHGHLQDLNRDFFPGRKIIIEQWEDIQGHNRAEITTIMKSLLEPVDVSVDNLFATFEEFLSSDFKKLPKKIHKQFLKKSQGLDDEQQIESFLIINFDRRGQTGSLEVGRGIF